MNRTLRLMSLLIIGLVLFALPATAQDGQQLPPTSLSCPSGYSLSSQWSRILVANDNLQYPDTVQESFSIAQPANGQLTVWSGVGHPEPPDNCAIGTQSPPIGNCDQGQPNEEFRIFVDGTERAFVPDHGEDQWKFFGNVDIGMIAAGDHTIRFEHSHETAGSAESVTYLVGLCTQNAPPPPMQGGCTPGYWKQDQHFDSWVATAYSFNQFVSSVFTVPGTLGLGNPTLLDALNYGGGPGATGGAKILLRAAVASLLNAAHPEFDFALSPAEVIAQVNAALASGNRDTMLSLAGTLDSANNYGCPLN